MQKKLFVRSLSFNVGDEELAALFSTIGKVKEGSAKVIVDRETGRSRGFGFIEMETQAEAEKAIRELNGTNHEGRTIEVSMAKENTGRGGAGDRGRGGYRGNRSDYR